MCLLQSQVFVPGIEGLGVLQKAFTLSAKSGWRPLTISESQHLWLEVKR